MGLGQAEHRSIRFLLGGTRLTIAVLSLMIGVSFGQKAQPNPLTPKARVPVQLEQPPQSGRHEITADDIEAFLDGVIPLQLARENIAGAVIAVVKDGKVLFSKGYGYADAKRKCRFRRTPCFGLRLLPSYSLGLQLCNWWRREGWILTVM